jgi:hypothetical protein
MIASAQTIHFRVDALNRVLHCVFVDTNRHYLSFAPFELKVIALSRSSRKIAASELDWLWLPFDHYHSPVSFQSVDHSLWHLVLLWQAHTGNPIIIAVETMWIALRPTGGNEECLCLRIAPSR